MPRKAGRAIAAPSTSSEVTAAEEKQRSRQLARPPALGAGLTAALLIGILVLAALLRVPWLTQAPPGLNQDEAANAWNAWCLLKTGTDQVGERWPIFYMHALGENRSTLFMYFMLPFQALGGMNVWTTRLPAAVGGVLTVLLVYWIAARLFGRTVGLMAALLLTLNPAHIVLSRLGHEAAIGPLLAALAFAVLIWAGFPVTDRETRPCIVRALVAGLIAGICCYGYPAVRLFVPVLLAGCVLFAMPSWLKLARSRQGAMAVAAFALALAATLGPLLYQHVAHAETIARRAEGNWLWEPGDAPSTRVAKVLHRYADHFGPDFLWINGDHNQMYSPAGFGAFDWYTLPLMLAGLVALVGRLRRSRAARILLCLLLVFPAGDCLNSGAVLGQAAGGSPIMTMHVLRSAPGLSAPILLSALGAAAVATILWKRSRRLTLVTAALAVVVIAACAGRFAHYYYGAYNRRPYVYHAFQEDLVEATRWLRPRLNDVDAVFVTGTGLNMPYVVMLVTLGYDPKRWFSEPRDVLPLDEWDYYFQVGKLHFYFPLDEDVAKLASDMAHDDRVQRVILLVRPGEQGDQPPTFTIQPPEGATGLAVYDVEL
jgi:4-amino-4-deoxy-L-arabinose transferase-like glycosyltransferase